MTRFQRKISDHESAPAVPRRPLPAHAAALGDASQMPVALRRRSLGGVARHRIRPRRHLTGRISLQRTSTGRNIALNSPAIRGMSAYRSGPWVWLSE
jgi:hypothetical protein